MVDPKNLKPGVSIVKYEHMPYLFVRYDIYMKLLTIKNSKKEYRYPKEDEFDELYFDANNIAEPIVIDPYCFIFCDNKIQISKTGKDNTCILNNIYLPFHLIQKEIEDYFKEPAIINDIDSLIDYIIK